MYLLPLIRVVLCSTLIKLFTVAVTGFRSPFTILSCISGQWLKLKPEFYTPLSCIIGSDLQSVPFVHFHHKSSLSLVVCLGLELGLDIEINEIKLGTIFCACYRKFIQNVFCKYLRWFEVLMRNKLSIL